MLGIDILLLLLFAADPNRAIDNSGIQIFIESHRTSSNGPGKILARVSGHYDSDSHPDKLVIYTYEHGPNRGDRVHGMFAVAFLTESFDTSEILFIPEAELISDRLHEYSYNGSELIITGAKRLPGASGSVSLYATLEPNLLAVIFGIGICGLLLKLSAPWSST